MEYYIDILIKPDAEKRENYLLNRVYTKLHKRLCELQSTDIGISFPHYKVLLGKIIRIHGSEQQLNKLQNDQWLGEFISYCKVSAIQVIPEEVQYRKISRIQPKMTEAKFRRLLQRGSISTDDTKAYKAKMFQQGLDTPYLELESTSSGHKYRRYLQFGEIVAEPVAGEFDQFGLSKTATIPWF